MDSREVLGPAEGRGAPKFEREERIVGRVNFCVGLKKMIIGKIYVFTDHARICLVQLSREGVRM